MKKHSGLYSAVSILLVIVLITGISASLIASGRTRPDNPISGQPEQLQAELLQGSGSTGGQNSRKEDTQPTAPSEDTKNTDRPWWCRRRKRPTPSGQGTRFGPSQGGMG